MASAPSPPAANGAPRLDPARARAVLLILSGIALMVTYVETMIIPAFGPFETFFDHAPITTVSWILSSYLVVGTAVTPLFSKVGDIWGKKRTLLLVLSIYAVAVTLAGFTPDIGAGLGISRGNQIYLLIAVRAIQGIGMAMFPLAFAMIGEEFPRAQVAGAQGAVAAMFAVGAALGLFGGAWVTQNFGWQLTYHTVIPIAFLMLIAAAVYLRESKVRMPGRLDLPGATFLGVALASALLGLSEGPTWGWGNLSAASLGPLTFGAPQLFIFAVILLAVFVVWELRSRHPIVDFARMAERNIGLSNVIGLLAGIAMFLMFLAIVFIDEGPHAIGLGLTPFQFGTLSLPATIGNMIAGVTIGRGVGKLGPKPFLLIAAGLMMVGGLFLAAFHATTLEMVLGPIPIFFGIISIFIAITNVVVLSSRPEETGIQTGMNQTFRNLGTAIGPVLGTTLLFSFTQAYTIYPAPNFGVPATLPSPFGLELPFLVIASMGAVVGLLALFVRNFRFTADGARVDAAARAPASHPPAELTRPTD